MDERMYENILTENEIVFHSFKAASDVAEKLMEEDYVVMLSREENLYILNFVNTCERNEPNRNAVAFNHRDYFEKWFYEPLSREAIDSSEKEQSMPQVTDFLKKM